MSNVNTGNSKSKWKKRDLDKLLLEAAMSEARSKARKRVKEEEEQERRKKDRDDDDDEDEEVVTTKSSKKARKKKKLQRQQQQKEAIATTPSSSSFILVNKNRQRTGGRKVMYTIEDDVNDPHVMIEEATAAASSAAAVPLSPPLPPTTVVLPPPPLPASVVNKSKTTKKEPVTIKNKNKKKNNKSQVGEAKKKGKKKKKKKQSASASSNYYEQRLVHKADFKNDPELNEKLTQLTIYDDTHPLPFEHTDPDQWCFPLILPANVNRVVFSDDNTVAATYADLRINMRGLLLHAATSSFTDAINGDRTLQVLRDAYVSCEICLTLAQEALSVDIRCPKYLCWVAAYTPSAIQNNAWMIEIAFIRYNMMILAFQMSFRQNKIDRPVRIARPDAPDLPFLSLKTFVRIAKQQLQAIRRDMMDDDLGAAYQHLQNYGLFPTNEMLMVMENLIRLLSLEWKIFHTFLPLFKETETFETLMQVLLALPTIDDPSNDIHGMIALGIKVPPNGDHGSSSNNNNDRRFTDHQLEQCCRHVYTAQLVARTLYAQLVIERGVYATPPNIISRSFALISDIFRDPMNTTTAVKQHANNYITDSVTQTRDIPTTKQVFLRELLACQTFKYVMQAQYVYKMLYLSLETCRTAHLSASLLPTKPENILAYCQDELDKLFMLDPHVPLFTTNLYAPGKEVLISLEKREQLQLPMRDDRDLPHLPACIVMPKTALKVDWAFKVWSLRTFAQFDPLLVAGVVELANTTRSWLASYFATLEQSRAFDPTLPINIGGGIGDGSDNASIHATEPRCEYVKLLPDEVDYEPSDETRKFVDDIFRHAREEEGKRKALMEAEEEEENRRKMMAAATNNEEEEEEVEGSVDHPTDTSQQQPPPPSQSSNIDEEEEEEEVL